MTLLGNSANNAAPPPIHPDTTTTFQQEDNYPLEFYAPKDAASMNFADSTTTNQCGGALVNRENHSQFDENRVGATLDGVPLSTVRKEFKTSRGHSNSGPSLLQEHGRPNLQDDSSQPLTSSGPLDFLANAALNARTNTTNTTTQPTRRVSTGAGSSLPVNKKTKTQGGQIAAKSGTDAIMATASSSHQEPESLFIFGVPQGAQTSQVWNGDHRHDAATGAGDQACSSFQNQEESIGAAIHYDDSTTTTTHAAPRRVSEEQAPTEEESPLREDLFDYTDQSEDEQELVSKTTKSAKSQGDMVDLTRNDGADQNAQATNKVVIPNVGKFGHGDSFDESDNDDSSDDGFWETTAGRTIRSKQVIHDDYLDSSPEKESPREELLSPSPAKSLVDDAKVPSTEQSPRSISPTYKDSDTDDSDFSLTTAARKSKKKKKRRKTMHPTANENVQSSFKETDADISLVANETGLGAGNTLAGNDQQSNKKKRKRLVASKSATPALESTRLQVSDRVFVEWAPDEWYWGIITAVVRARKSEKDQYSILFDDGDKLDVFRKSIITVPKFRAFFGREPPPLPNTLTVPNVVISMTPQQMYAHRCKKCSLCIKPDCGACWSCRTNKKSPNNRLRVCLQKMCLELSDSQKKQPAKGVLPNDWKFLFTRDKPYNSKSGQPHVPGLFICHPVSDKNFRSIEAAVVYCPKLEKFNPNVVADFNHHIGVKQTSSTAMTTKRKRSPKAATIPPALPAEVNTQVNVTDKPIGSAMTLAELYEAKCGACENCRKDDCGQCYSCVSAGTTSSSRQVCIQKMCCNVPLAQKAQPMPPTSMFPVGWKYVMDPTRKSYRQNGKVLGPPNRPGAWGLKIIPPKGQEFYSVERAKGKGDTLNDVNEDAFYEHIGAPKSESSSPESSRMTTTLSVEAGTNSTSKASEASANAANGAPLKICGACTNCTKPACGKCARCTASSSGYSQQCFQKMCFKIPVEAKAEPAVGFPKGWKFFFAEDPSSSGSYTFQPVPGLNIRSAGGKKFRSVEATSVCSLGDLSTIARKFYTHVGLVDRIPTQQQSIQASQVCNTSKLTSTKPLLSKYRVVGSRVFCFQGKAQGRWGVITEKLEVTPNVYTFSVRLEEDYALLEDLDSRSVLSEASYKAKTGRTPPRPREAGGEHDLVSVSPRKETDGLSAGQRIITTTDHFLVGKSFSFSWTDLQGRKKILYGRVVECQKNEQNGEVRSFKVVYSERSRDLINGINNGGASVVPDSQMLPFPMVLGGCLSYEQQNGGTTNESSLLDDAGRLIHFWNWITPDMRYEDFVEMNSVRMPRLTLVVRGYRLELNVRESSIAGAGNGVYVSCTPLFDENGSGSEPLVLKAGELVDLGLYGPFRLEDKKLEPVFFVKNFMHSHFCEEWAFESGDSQYQVDITDDVTGDIHSEAKKRIFAYVNESNVDGAVCIRAEHDAEGNVHYLLGHSHQSQGSLVIPSNGVPMEVFVNYGAGYEAVRVRKGYSFLSDGSDKKLSLMKAIKLADVADVKEMDRFGAAEVEAAVDFLFLLFGKDEDFSIRVIHRAVIVAVVLQRRARQLFLDGNDNADIVDDVPNTVNMRKLLQHSRNVVTLLLDMVQGGTDEPKSLHAAGNVDKLCALVLKTSFSESELAELGDLIE